MANEYLQLMEGLEAGDESRFQASTTQAVGGNADQAAAAKRVAGYLGVPTSVVEGAPEDAERRAQVQRLNEDTADAPALRRMYGNADWAKLAHDDSGPLRAVEKAVRAFLTPGGQRKPMAPGPVVMRGTEYSERVREFMRQNPLVDADTARALVGQGVIIDNQSDLIGPPGKGPKPTVPSVAAGLYNALVQGARATDAGLGRMAADYLGKLGVPGMAEQAERHALDGRRAQNRILLTRPDFETTGAEWMYSGLESIAQMAPGLAVSILTRNPELATAFTLGQFGVSSTGQAYNKYRDRGATIGEATLASVLEGGVEVGTELLPMKYLTQKFGKVGLGDLVSNFLAKDAAGEQIATLLQDAIDTAVANPDKTFGDYLAERPEAAARTLVATLTQFGVLAGANSAARRTFMAVEAQLEAAAGAEDQAKQLTEILQLAGGSKLRERDAGSFAEFVHEATKDNEGDGNVYVDASTLADVLSQSEITLDQLQEMSPAAAAQLADAVELNGTVAIPVADLIGKLSGTELEQKLVPHLRPAEDGLSQEEAKMVTAQAQQFLEQAAQRVVEQAADAAVAQLSQAKVKATLVEQLNAANRFTKDVNDAYATLVSSFYTAVAARFGITAAEMYARYPLRVQAARPEGMAIEQGGQLTQPAVVREQVREWVQEMLQRHQLEKFDVSLSAGATLKVGLMVVPEAARGQGKSTAVMKELTDFADRFGFRVVLTPAQKEDGFGTTSRERLVAFYKRFGFIENKGRAKDFEISEAMYREPQSLQQGPRGSFSPGSLTITLLEKADLSTFLHETGHFFLEALAGMAAQPNAPAEIQQDMLTVLEWFGVRTLEEWNAMSLEDQRPHHEKFAESFEQYLFEGKAPSRELASLFGRFRAWLTNVYRSLQSFLSTYNTNLSDEVRAVFDRLLATQEEIEQAEADSGFVSMLGQFEGKVDPALLAHYKKLTDEASEDAMSRLHARSLRDLKWIVNARSSELKKLTKDVAEKREAVLAEVTAEVDATPEMRAAARLEEIMRTTPEVKDARKDWRDRRAAALERTREEVKAKYVADADAQGIKGLQKGQFLAKNRKAIDHEVNGKMIDWERENPFPARPPLDDVPLDAIGEELGFTSGDHMLQAIDAFGPRDVAIEGITNQRMLERYGDLVTKEGIQRAANEAVHNEARARAVAAELQALQASITAKAPTGRTITAQTKAGRVQYQQTTNVIVEAARRFADNLVARQKVRELRTGQYQAAERRAAKTAMELAAKGKSQEAAAAKRDQLLNFYAAKETLGAIDEIDKGVKYLRKVGDSDTLDPAYAEQIAVMLERFDLRPVTNKALERRATLLEWVESQRAIGVEPDIPQGLLDEAVRKSYKDMTVEEFRGLVDTVKQIEHLGRLKHKLLTAKDEREFTDVVQRITDRIIESGGERQVENITPNTVLGQKLLKLRKFAAEHVKAATWARVMDGGTDGGPVWEYIIRAANEAGNQEVEMRAQATRDLTALVAPLLPSGRMDAKVFIPEINASMNRQARIAVALNMGNESNRQRLMGGHSWTAEQLQAIGRTLTETEWRFVQKVWDYFEGYRPEIGAKEKRVSGVEPKWIDPLAFEVETADGKAVKLRGGYYPVKYDPEASHRAEQHADAEAAKQQMRGAYTSATTRRSFTKTRADEVTGRPLLLSLDGIYQGVNEVIHDLSWHEFLIDANRLVGNGKIAAAMRQKFGAGAHQQFKSWLQDVARGETSVVGEGFAGWLRSGVSISGLGFNVMTAAIQPLGITQSITRVGVKWVGRGIARYAGAPIETTDMVRQKSTFMQHRAQTRLRELAEVQANVQGRGKAREAVDVGAYFLMLKAQQAVDVPTWVGAYEKAIVEGGFDEAHAVQLADQAVIDAQGSGMLKDQAAIERGGQFKKLLTVFYSFFNTTANNLVLQTMTHTSKAKLAADYLLLAVVPVVLGAALRDALTPGDSGDWEDPEKLAKRLAGEEISFLMGLMVGVREFTAAGQAVTGTAKYGTDYSGPAGVRVIADTTKLGEQVHQGELDPAFRKALVNVAGELMRLPAAQMNRSITGFEALRDGKTKNPLALVGGYQEPK